MRECDLVNKFPRLKTEYLSRHFSSVPITDTDHQPDCLDQMIKTVMSDCRKSFLYFGNTEWISFFVQTQNILDLMGWEWEVAAGCCRFSQQALGEGTL